MQDFVINIGIKHDVPFINSRKVQRELLKTKGKARGFQHLSREVRLRFSTPPEVFNIL